MSASPGTNDALIAIMVEWLTQQGYIIFEPNTFSNSSDPIPYQQSHPNNNLPTSSTVPSSPVSLMTNYLPYTPFPNNTLSMPSLSLGASALPSSSSSSSSTSVFTIPDGRICKTCPYPIEPDLDLVDMCKWCTKLASKYTKPGHLAHRKQSLEWRKKEEQGLAMLSVSRLPDGTLRMWKQNRIDISRLSVSKKRKHTHEQVPVAIDSTLTESLARATSAPSS